MKKSVDISMLQKNKQKRTHLVEFMTLIKLNASEKYSNSIINSRNACANPESSKLITIPYKNAITAVKYNIQLSLNSPAFELLPTQTAILKS